MSGSIRSSVALKLAAAVAPVLFVAYAQAQVLRVDMNSDNLMETPNPDGGYSQTQGLNGDNTLNGNPNPPFDPWFINGGRDSSGGDPRLQALVFNDNDVSNGGTFTAHYPNTRVQLTAANGDVIDSGRRFGMLATNPPGYSYNDLFRDYIFNTNTSANYDPNSPTAGEHTANDFNTDPNARPHGPLNINISGMTGGNLYAVTLYTYDKWMDGDTASAGQSVGVSRMRFIDATTGTDGNTGISMEYGRNSAPGGLTNDSWSVTMLVRATAGGTISINEEALADFGGSGNTLNSAILNGIEVNALASQWQGGSGTNYSTAGNWTGPVPNGTVQGAFNNQIAYFGPAGSPQTVTLDVPVTVGQVVLDSSNAYSIGGSQTLSLAGGGIAVLSGNHTISAPVAAAGNMLDLTVVPANSTLDLTGSLTVVDTHLTVPNDRTIRGTVTKQGAGRAQVSNLNLSVVNVNAGTLAVKANGTNAGTSKIGTLVVSGSPLPTGALDLNDNDMVVTGTTTANLQALINTARHGGAWDQGGLTSSSAKTQTNHATTLGVLTGAEYSTVGGTGTFSGQSYADTDTLIKYTWYGDTDFNGKVNFDDYVRTDNGFNGHLSGWLNGDFDGNGQVNFDDYVLIDLAFNTQSGTLGRALSFVDGSDRSMNGMNGAALQRVVTDFGRFGNDYASQLLSAVPEPASLAFAGVATSVAMFARRRRRVKRA